LLPKQQDLLLTFDDIYEGGVLNQEYKNRLEETATLRLYEWDVLHSDYPGELWHYTGVKGIRGILSEGHLRFSDAAFLNDHSELAYAVDLAEEVIKEKLSAPPGPLVQEYLEAFQRRIKSDKENRREYGFVNPAFVACFCKDGDSLHLWRAYTGNGRGYSIGFFPDMILAQLKPLKIEEAIYRPPSDKTSTNVQRQTRIYEPALRSVIYEVDQQRDLLGKLIESFIQVVNEFEPVLQSGNVNNWTRTAFSNRLYPVFYHYLCSFKHPTFRDEKEWRLIYTPKFSPPSEDQEGIATTAIKYRESGDYIVPYLTANVARVYEASEGEEKPKGELKAKIIDLPFETIIAGPGLDETLARASLNSFLLRRGYLGSLVSIEHSSVPLRKFMRN
jgi:hypothetical protein